MFLQCRANVFVKIAVSWAQIKKTKKAQCGSLSFTRHKCIFCFKNKRLDWIWRLASNPTSFFDPFFAWLRVVSRRLRFNRRLLWGTIYFIQQRYLVDPASSHMLVSKIKPCMSKYKQLYTVKLRTAHYISYNLFDGDLLHG